MWMLLLLASVAPPVADPLPPGAIARLGSTRWRVTWSASGLCASPDGRRIAIGHDTQVRVLDARTGVMVGSHSEPDTHYFRVCEWNDQAGRLLIRMNMTQVYLVDLHGKMKEQRFEAMHACFSGDGKQLYCAHQNQLSIYETGKGKQVQTWPFASLPYTAVEGIVAHPRRAEFAFVNEDEQVGLFDVRTGKRRWMVRGHSPAKAARHLTLPQVHLAFSPTGDWLATAGQDGTVRLWHPNDGRPGPVLELGHAPCVGMHWSREGFLVVAFHDGTLAVWKERERVWQRKAPGPWFAVSFCVAQSGTQLFAQVRSHTRLYHWDLASGSSTADLTGPYSSIEDARWLDANRMVMIDATGRAVEWDGTDARVRNKQDFGAGRFALSADGTRILSAKALAQKVELTERLTGKRLREVVVPTSKNVEAMALADDGKRFALGLGERSGGTVVEVEQHDESTAARTWKHTIHEASTRGLLLLTYSQDGAMLVESAYGDSFGGRGVLRVRETATGKQRHLLPVETPRRAAFDPTGRSVIATLGLFRGHELGVWDLRNPSPPRGWKHRLDSLGGLEVSPCGRLLAMIGATRPSSGIHVWELRTLSPVRQFDCPTPGSVIRFAPEGRRLLSGTYDGDIVVWDVTGRLLGRGPQLRSSRLGVDAQRRCWDCLSSKDARIAYAAAWELASSPKVASALLARWLAPVTPESRTEVEQLLRELDSEDFRTRERADRELRKRGEAFVKHIHEVLPTLSLEGQRRLERIQKSWKDSAASLRNDRAVFALEQMGEPGRGLLYRLAEGVPEAEITQLARAALKRQKTGGTARRDAPAP